MGFLKFIAKYVLVLLVLTIVLDSCRAKKRILKSPAGYNFGVVLTYKLDLKLKEISGVCWDPKSNVFLAINDEKGTLFFLDKDIMVPPTEFSFGSKGDYEDVAIMDGIPYILRSDGMLTRFAKDSAGKGYGQEVGKLDLSGTNDFETLYYDNTRRALIVLCKNCDMDNKKNVSAFAFYPDSIGFDPKPIFTIDGKKVEELAPLQTSKLQPSAAAIHPVLQKLFILSSASNQLVVTDLDGSVEAVYALSEKLFPQPEGITFKQNGDMYISNEGVTTKGTLLKFVYHR